MADPIDGVPAPPRPPGMPGVVFMGSTGEPAISAGTASVVAPVKSTVMLGAGIVNLYSGGERFVVSCSQVDQVAVQTQSTSGAWPTGTVPTLTPVVSVDGINWQQVSGSGAINANGIWGPYTVTGFSLFAVESGTKAASAARAQLTITGKSTV